MIEAFICDAVRTPIGRYGGVLSGVSHRRSRRSPDRGADAAQCGGRLAGRGRRRLRLRQPGRGGQPEPGAHGGPARGPAGRGAGRHREPAVRLRARCARDRGTAGTLRRGRVTDRGRRREHEPRALRAVETGCGFQPDAAALRYDDRVALRQPVHEGAVRHRLDARDRRERGGGVQGFARGQGRLRVAQPATCARRAGERSAGSRDRPGHASREERRDRRSSTATNTRARPVSIRWPSSGRRSVRAARSRRGMPRASTTGACALIVASERAAVRHGLRPRARFLGAAVAGLPPRIMGMGPAPASEN